MNWLKPSKLELLQELLQHEYRTASQSFKTRPVHWKICLQCISIESFFLKNSSKSLSLVVVNSDDCDNPGSHRIAISIDKNGDVEHFHSYGICSFCSSVIMSFDKKSQFNLTCFRGNFLVCGQYCFLYLLLKSKGFSLKNLQNIPHETKTIA